jgi:hypothetical protein
MFDGSVGRGATPITLMRRVEQDYKRPPKGGTMFPSMWFRLSMDQSNACGMQVVLFRGRRSLTTASLHLGETIGPERYEKTRWINS